MDRFCRGCRRSLDLCVSMLIDVFFCGSLNLTSSQCRDPNKLGYCVGVDEGVDIGLLFAKVKLGFVLFCRHFFFFFHDIDFVFNVDIEDCLEF